MLTWIYSDIWVIELTRIHHLSPVSLDIRVSLTRQTAHTAVCPELTATWTKIKTNLKAVLLQNMTSEILTLFLVIFRSKSSKRRPRGSKPRTVSANCPTVSRLSQLLSPQPCCRWPARVWKLTPLRSPGFSRRRPAPLSPLWRARKWCSRFSRRLYADRFGDRQLDASTETDN